MHQSRKRETTRETGATRVSSSGFRSIAFFGGVQLVFLGLIGEYVLAIFQQVRGRPYVIERERVNVPSGTTADEKTRITSGTQA